MATQPNWTEIVQAIAAASGVVFLMVNFWYLRQADKQQQKQIDLLIQTNKDPMMPQFIKQSDPIVDSRNPNFMVVSLKNNGGSAKKIIAVSNDERIILRENSWDRISKNDSFLLVFSVDVPFEKIGEAKFQWDIHENVVIDIDLTFFSDLDVKYLQKIGGVNRKENWNNNITPA